MPLYAGPNSSVACGNARSEASASVRPTTSSFAPLSASPRLTKNGERSPDLSWKSPNFRQPLATRNSMNCFFSGFT
jgi:hypothetical protein